jgi:hypothetical protein
MTHSSKTNWLTIGLDAWLLGAEAATVITLRSARLAMGGAGAWQEAQRMVSEKGAANFALGMALATGRMGASAEGIAHGTVAHYRRRVRANQRRLSKR